MTQKKKTTNQISPDDLTVLHSLAKYRNILQKDLEIAQLKVKLVELQCKNAELEFNNLTVNLYVKHGVGEEKVLDIQTGTFKDKEDHETKSAG